VTAFGVDQPGTPATVRREVRRQLITARLPEPLVLRPIDGPCFLNDLAGDPLVVAIGIATRVRRDLRAIDRDHASLDQIPPRRTTPTPR
jgi:hypothetical protein